MSSPTGPEHERARPRRRAASLLLAILALGVLLAIVAALLLVPREPPTAEPASVASRPAAVAPTAVPRPTPTPRVTRSSPEAVEAPAPAREAEPSSTPKADSTGVSIDVVDEAGNLLRDGKVTLKAPDSIQLMNRGMSPLRWLKDVSLAAGNPVVLADLPDDADGLDVEATALVTDRPPATAKFTLRLHRVETVRLVVPKGRSVEVRVLEQDGETPVGDAAVVSVTDAERAGVDIETLRGTKGPGAAVADADGRCVVGGVGAAEQEFEVTAPDHERTTVKWTEGPLFVRMKRVSGYGTVTVTVIDPDGRPAAGIKVEVIFDDLKATTGEDGRAVFERVSAGSQRFHLTFPDEDWDRWYDAMQSGLAISDHVVVEAGGRHELALGLRQGGASFEARIVTEDGSPVAGLEVSVMADHALHRLTSDAGGLVRIQDLAPSKVTTFIKIEGGGSWLPGDIDVKDGDHVSKTWTLGEAMLRGHVVTPSDGKPLAGASVYVSGPLDGLDRTDAEGRFEFRRALAGTFKVEMVFDAKSDFIARPVEIVLPTEKDVVLEAVRGGRIAARFAAGDRASLRDARIELRAAGAGGESFEPPKQGDADLVSGRLLPGRYEITVDLAGRVRTFPVEVKSGETATVELGAP